MANYAESLSVKAPKAGKKVLQSISIERAKNGGHILEHRFSNDGPGYRSPESHVFGADEGNKLIAHLSKHLGIQAHQPETEEEMEPEE